MNKKLLREYIGTILKENETKQISEITQSTQSTLFTPADFSPLDAITPQWLSENSVADKIYDSNTMTFYDAGIPALLMAYEASSLENEGEMFEDGMIKYAESIGLKGMVRIGGEGEDLKMGNRTYESKKSKNSSPTLMFNSTFPKSKTNHFYLFTTNVPSRAQIKKAMSWLDKSGTTWENELKTQKDSSSELQNKISQIDNTIANWDILQRDPEELKVQQSLEDPTRQQQMFESVTFDGVTFNTKKELISYRKTLIPEKSKKAILNALGANMRVYVVPSEVIRVAILSSAFPGAFEGDEQIFDPKTGNIVQGGAEKIVDDIKARLDDFGLEYKIAKKIAPALAAELESGLGKTYEEGWSMNLGLLGIRIKVYIEPKGRSK